MTTHTAKTEPKMWWIDEEGTLQLPDGATYWNKDLDLRGTEVISTGELKDIAGFFDANGVKTLRFAPNLESVGDYADFQGTTLEELPMLEIVNSELYLNGVRTFHSAPKLKWTGSDIHLEGTSVAELPLLDSEHGGKLYPPDGKIALFRGVLFLDSLDDYLP